MGFGREKAFKVFYYPASPGSFGTKVAIVSAENKNEASYKFQKEYKGQYHTIDRIEEC